MERNNRTWLCTVVFLDVVGYTTRPVSGQVKVRAHLTGLVNRATRNVAEDDRILVDTGDGAAICFLVDPEEALFFALNFREALINDMERGEIDYQVRIGINLGPVKVIRDVNGRRNTIGDGINVAQRVMDFAGPNQVLVSRSFFEVVGCLSDEYAELFSYLGVRKDKHIKEYDIYEVAVAGPILANYREDLSGQNTRLPLTEEASVSATACWDAEKTETLVRDLAEYIGPLARILVRREGARVGDFHVLCQRLAAAIPEGSQRDRFLQRVLDHGVDCAAKADDSPLSSPAVQESGPMASTWPDGALDRVQTRLAEVLGPVARLLVKRAARRAHDLPELYRLLADEISDEGEREAFLGSL